MMSMVETPIVYNWDADVVVPPLQVLKSIQLLRDNKADMTYSYDGRFARVPRNLFETMEKALDVGVFGGMMFKGMRQGDAPSVGGAMAWKRSIFMEGGGEDEKYISYAPEDRCRFETFQKLGYRVERVKGVLYHMDHFISINSSEQNPHFQANWQHYNHKASLTVSQLKNYIKINNPFN